LRSFRYEAVPANALTMPATSMTTSMPDIPRNLCCEIPRQQAGKCVWNKGWMLKTAVRGLSRSPTPLTQPCK
jgi:hypothetical protein